jgi:DNA segregation ATPase FtsK/SpoIIIE-like protein
MTFDFALWGEGQIPVTLVCEEAHRYVPANPNAGFEPCKRAIAKIAKEGRKYGASLCIVTQRPAEIDPTILSQCNTVFALRMSNDRDQQIVQSAVSDTGSGLLEFLPALGQREAIAFGDGVTLPVRIRFDELPPSALPRSSTAKFSEKWQSSIGDEDFLQRLVERWRSTGISEDDDSQAQMLAEAIGFNDERPEGESAPHATAPGVGGAPLRRPSAEGRPSSPSLRQRPDGDTAPASQRLRRRESAVQSQPTSEAQPVLRHGVAAGVGATAAPASAAAEAGPQPVELAAADEGDEGGSALRSLRNRLLKR